MASSEQSERFRFTSRQQLVYSSLAERSQEGAELYESAFRVIQDDGNPSRLRLGAHSLREMIAILPKVMDLPILAEAGRLGDKVNALGEVWSSAEKSDCHKEGAWTGEIDAPLRKLLHSIRELFEWHTENRKKRRQVATEMFRGADPARLALPENLEKRRVQEWLDLNDYFVRVAHGSSTTADEFATNSEALEQILLDSIYRQPSEDLSALDRILKEAKDA